MSTRERCPKCGKTITLNQDGTLRMHNGNEYDGLWGLTCDGSRRPPIDPADRKADSA